MNSKATQSSKKQEKRDFPGTTASAEAVPRKPRTHVRLPLTIWRAYKRFLELPAVFVVAVGWMVGVALLGSIALVLYWTVRVLVQSIAASI